MIIIVTKTGTLHFGLFLNVAYKNYGKYTTKANAVLHEGIAASMPSLRFIKSTFFFYFVKPNLAIPATAHTNNITFEMAF